jgi:uncharacterized Zn finger protein
MTVTLTANYRETLAPETAALIDRLTEEMFDLGAMLEFIDEHSEEDFREFYIQYVELGEEYGYEAIDLFINEVAALDELYKFEIAYIGEYNSAADMAECFFVGDGDVERLDYRIVVDWEETAEYLLRHDVDRFGHHYFRTYF